MTPFHRCHIFDHAFFLSRRRLGENFVIELSLRLSILIINLSCFTGNHSSAHENNSIDWDHCHAHMNMINDEVSEGLSLKPWSCIIKSNFEISILHHIILMTQEQGRWSLSRRVSFSTHFYGFRDIMWRAINSNRILHSHHEDRLWKLLIVLAWV